MCLSAGPQDDAATESQLPPECRYDTLAWTGSLKDGVQTASLRLLLRGSRQISSVGRSFVPPGAPATTTWSYMSHEGLPAWWPPEDVLNPLCHSISQGYRRKK